VELQLKLTTEYRHPAALKRAQAKLDTTEQELRLAREQVQSGVIRAPKDGVVVYKPLHLGSEFRTVRIGDSMYPNQPFMALTDMRDLVVHCDIPEADLSRVQEGKDAFIQPLAYPGLKLRGLVESVSPMAQNAPGRPTWEKFFHVVIGLVDAGPQVRPGMSATAHILSYHRQDAVTIPRAAVWWENGKPFGRVVTGSTHEVRPLKLGMADERSYEVVEGLQPDDAVLLE
jgi:HlyD family secretion protein